MDQIYPIKIKVKLTPIYFDRVPTISFGINGAREQMSLSTEKWVEFEYSTTAKTGYFEIEMTGKTNQDTDLINNKDILEKDLTNKLAKNGISFNTTK